MVPLAFSLLSPGESSRDLKGLCEEDLVCFWSRLRFQAHITPSRPPEYLTIVSFCRRQTRFAGFGAHKID